MSGTARRFDAADRIAADFAEIQFEDHEARKLAVAYQELREANQWLRDDVAVKVETIRDAERDFIGALDLHKERIRLLQETLCECPHREFFQAEYHDETCPVFVVAEKQKREYEPRV